jgi:hypothetical protein
MISLAHISTTRKRLIAGAPKSVIPGALEPAVGNGPVIMSYCRRTSPFAGGNTSYCRRTSLVRRWYFIQDSKKRSDLDLDLDLDLGRVLVQVRDCGDCGTSITVLGAVNMVLSMWPCPYELKEVAAEVRGGRRRTLPEGGHRT